MIKLLTENPLLLLFLVAAIGYPLGRFRVGGSCLGVAAVLFVGLAIGSIHPDLKLPEIIYILGLALFVYTVGLSSGPSFVASLRKDGIRNNLLVVSLLVFAASLALLAQKIFDLKATMTAGMFAGSFTNTPALAGALETLKHVATRENLNQLLSEPIVGYSVTYPMGVIGVVFAISVAQKIWKIDYAGEARNLKVFGASSEPLRICTIQVTRQEALNETLSQLADKHEWRVMFGRVKRHDQMFLAEFDKRPEAGDLLVTVGTAEDLECAARYLGEKSEVQLQHGQDEFDVRRIFVSNNDVEGRRLRDLGIRKKFGALITRVRRGDDDFLPDGNMTLEPGDRVRVLAPRDRMGAVTDFFGDSYRAVSEVDILTFSVGLALGLLLGAIPLPLPGGITFKLGFAGGPLIVALILGTIKRTGNLIWTLPYSANATLRQIGLVFFLAGIGTRAGYGFLSTFSKGGGVTLFVVGAAITFTATALHLWIGHRLLRIPMSILTGMVAGLFTQPAVLGYALEQTDNDLPNIGYASVYPVAMIAKILLVQALLSFSM
jgi:putative transport protein